jgi:glycosyltransferase involved in cell wall biosynthesis
MIDIIVPVYNEGENIKMLFDEMSDKIKVSFNVMLIYDFEEDTTVAAVNEIRNKYDFPAYLVKNKYGKGVLNAIKTGLEYSKSEAVLVVMADLSDDLAVVNKMYVMIQQKGYDLVCGSRYMCGGRQLGGPLLKKMMSCAAGVSLHYISGIPTHDVTNSFKIYSRKVLNAFKIESNGGFELGMELTVKAFVNGFKIGEVPATWCDRTAGTSKFKLWNWLPHYLHWYFYCLKRRWFSVKK